MNEQSEAETQGNDESCFGGMEVADVNVWRDETAQGSVGVRSMVHTIVRAMLINLTAISRGFWVKERG